MFYMNFYETVYILNSSYKKELLKGNVFIFFYLGQNVGGNKLAKLLLSSKFRMPV